MLSHHRNPEPAKQKKRDGRRNRAHPSRGDGFSFFDDFIDLVGDLLTFWR